MNAIESFGDYRFNEGITEGFRKGKQSEREEDTQNIIRNLIHRSDGALSYEAARKEAKNLITSDTHKD